jgi:hypothetical protein
MGGIVRRRSRGLMPALLVTAALLASALLPASASAELNRCSGPYATGVAKRDKLYICIKWDLSNVQAYAEYHVSSSASATPTVDVTLCTHNSFGNVCPARMRWSNVRYRAGAVVPLASNAWGDVPNPPDKQGWFAVVSSLATDPATGKLVWSPLNARFPIHSGDYLFF